MNVLPLQVFVSLMLVLGAVLALAWSIKQADHEHADRLSLLPLDDDGQPKQDQPSQTPAPTPQTPAATKS